MKTTICLPLLRALSHGRCQSSEKLEKQFFLTRSDIWQQVSYLRSLGVPIEASDKGYRILGGVYIPDEVWLGSQLDFSIDFVPEIESTSSHLVSHGFEDTVLLTLHQTLGRGRRGRVWHDTPGKTLMFSMGMFVNQLDSSVSLLPVSVGTALCDFFNKLDVPVKLKWPNDIWINDRKLAGFLIETRRVVHDKPYLVIGLGLNLGLPNRTDLAFASIEPYLNWSDKHTYQLLKTLRSVCLKFPTLSSRQIQQAYCQVSRLEGQQVCVMRNAETIVGTAQGVDPLGRLCIFTERGLMKIAAGDVKVRPKD